MSKSYPIFISCQIGFEEQVKHELLLVLQAAHNDVPYMTFAELDQSLVPTLVEQFQVQVKVGGVMAKLPLAQIYQMQMWSRVGARILLQLSDTYVESDIDLYNAIYCQSWTEILTEKFEFKVTFNGTNEALKNSHFSSLRVKDAIVDYYTNLDLPRPNINTEDPDVVIDCRLHRNRLVLSLDLTGTMHKRYRHRAGIAPMRETLAANLILRSGWDKTSPVYNPMCGSGVLAIEAALIALNVAPGLFCEQHHLDFWRGHDVSLWITEYNKAKQAKLTLEQLPNPKFKVYASDNDRTVLQVAKNNAALVGVADVIEFEEMFFENLTRVETSPTGLVIMNPPYGIRLSNERALYSTYYEIGEVVRNLFPGWILGVISASDKLLSCISLSPSRKWKVKNSNLECSYCVYGIRANVAHLNRKTSTQTTLVVTPSSDYDGVNVNTNVPVDTTVGNAADDVNTTRVVTTAIPVTSPAINSATIVNPITSAATTSATSTPEITSIKQEQHPVVATTSQDSTSTTTTTIHGVSGSKEPVTLATATVTNSDTSGLHSDDAQLVQRQPLDQQAQDFYNRLGKNARRLNSYLKRKQVHNYRLYDADIPTFNVAVDVYTDMHTQQQYYVVQEYQAGKDIPLHKTVKRSLQALAMVQRYALEVNKNSQSEPIIIDKIRERQKGDSQYQKMASEQLGFTIEEYGCKFQVNLTDYIDTGIFLDNRDLRFYLRKLIKRPNMSFLNLFAYTATATVHAIKGGATFTKSVDMSATYCTWGQKNIHMNLPKAVHHSAHKIIQADVLAWLEAMVTANMEKFDVVFCDPPTFSNSKRMEQTFDVQRDHVHLLSQIRELLTEQGQVVFCNNKRGFKLDQEALTALGFTIQNLTQATMPADFANSKIHQAWLLTRL